MKSINIIGFGIMGIQIAAFFNLIGYKVTVWNRTFPESKLKRLGIEKRYLEKKIKHVSEKYEIIFLDRIEMLKPAITIEVLAENLQLKQKILQDLSYDFHEYILFSNSSSLSPDEIYPDSHGLHFFNPIHSINLVETTYPAESLPLLTDIQGAGVHVVLTKKNRGYVANYVLFQEIAASLMLVEKYGYDTRTIDIVQNALGRQSSIFDIIDIVGVDVSKSILDNLHETDNTIVTPSILKEALDAGIYGKKNKTSIRTILDK